jgi:histone H1/5
MVFQRILTWIQAPAVEEKAPVILGKTKSGRVTKSTAPSAPATKAAATKKKAAPKKATPKKKAAA